MPHIRIRNAWQGTLDHISVDLPKNSLTVVTGVSGSGKSTLLVDVLFQECQRKYLEALSMQGIAKPGVERIQGASPAVLIPHTAANRSPRSTVGTLTDIYTELLMLFEKLGRRRCRSAGRRSARPIVRKSPSGGGMTSWCGWIARPAADGCAN